MKTVTQGRFLHTSTRKMGLVAATIRRRSAAEALIVLENTDHKAAKLLRQVLVSAIANAETNHNQKRESLLVDTVFVGPAPTLKRFRPRAKGMAAPIKHRLTHIKVILDEQTAPVKKESSKVVTPTKKPTATAKGAK